MRGIDLMLLHTTGACAFPISFFVISAKNDDF